ncbi:hypothetical protein BDN67DRAFT_383116 [Paxillus ammoniavirescens]|nr:hypothetical protein BDN67DRAFT_383116 [Paxillus ammoniavirescens]
MTPPLKRNACALRRRRRKLLPPVPMNHWFCIGRSSSSTSMWHILLLYPLAAKYYFLVFFDCFLTVMYPYSLTFTAFLASRSYHRANLKLLFNHAGHQTLSSDSGTAPEHVNSLTLLCVQQHTDNSSTTLRSEASRLPRFLKCAKHSFYTVLCTLPLGI